MKILVLRCAADGSQRLEEREVPEDWLRTESEETEVQNG